MSKNTDEIDFGLEASPRQLVRFIGAMFGAMSTIGLVACVMVFMTTPSQRDFERPETASRGLPSMLGASVALATGGKTSAYAMDANMREICKQSASMQMAMRGEELSSIQRRRVAQACGE
jgi:lipid-binding SYLF domain-containing protein